jgi:prepilin-type N-terminal cleavage/methylation domain-containing protein
MSEEMNQRNARSREDGFSMVELLVSLTVMLVVAGAALSVLSYAQKMYSTQQMQADMHGGLRGAFELMSQEIGQAGALSSATYTLTPAITSGAAAQSVAINSTNAIFVGQKLVVDTGASQETVTVTAIGTNQISAIFSKSHAAGAVVAGRGVFPQGVLSSSTSTSLKIFGDINADGSLVYVQYDCDTAAGTLARSVTTITPGVTTQNASTFLLTNLVANPSGTPCFQYAGSITAAGYTFVPSVGVSLTVQTSQRDPQTGSFVTMTKSFSNLSSRNVLAGLALAQASPAVTNRLQPTPPSVPLSAP